MSRSLPFCMLKKSLPAAFHKHLLYTQIHARA